MPTVDRIDKLRVVIYPHDHPPAHVHVMGNGCEAVFQINGPLGAITLRENYGFAKQEVNRIHEALATKRASLLKHWRAIHGTH